MKSLLYKVISFFFPHYCLGCKKHGPIICTKCLETIPPPERDLPRGIYALFDYRDPLIKKALWNLKYGNISELAEIAAPFMHNEIIEIFSEEYALLEAKNIVVVPIPTSGDKTKKRSYNHAYKIAEAVVAYQNKIQNNQITTPTYQPLLTEAVHLSHLAADAQGLALGSHPKLTSSIRRGINTHWQLVDPLIKIKKTQRQAMVKGRDKRIKNIQGAYQIKSEFLQSKNSLPDSFFIIIDDITTTGASINEAMRALKPLKPRHVFGITIAH